ncbi:hypothetical protein GCM10022631_29630 [Deinococcus rubellus]|uniref:Uncharacterized protein n=1 Tax=Deinococcus rubellus TaxID=1889240 RepID=A0ABY5YJ86_9DEIO|nr:hypothetical protein [Deinococcus rubellus]UWX64191.1 hypothetical protein N0D28_00480 [Deinococcus rubellus]
MADETKTPVSNDPNVPSGPLTQPGDALNKAQTTELTGTVPTTPADTAGTDVAKAADAGNGAVDAQAAAKAGRAKREAANNKKTTDDAAGVVPTGGIVRQLEDGTETDRRTGSSADKSLAGEDLPVLRPNEPDPRQGVTTGDLTNPGIPDGEDMEAVTFLRSYHIYNTGESAVFSGAEADRLKALGVAE